VIEFIIAGIGSGVLIGMNLFFPQILVMLELAGHLVITWKCA
jgi:hypothetical protein